MRLSWRCDRPANAPSSLNPSVDSLIRDPGYIAPFASRFPFSVKFQKNCYLAISNLRLCIGPSAILRAVTFFVINSINGMGFARRVTHVSNEICKRFPSIANTDSVFKIDSLVGLSRPVAAPSNHERPCVVFLRASAAIWIAAMAVFCIGFARPFYLKASARLCMAISKLVCSYGYGISALAKAYPFNASARIIGAIGNRQSPVCMPTEVYK